MLIVALVLAVIGLAALVTAVVTSNELIAWVCIGVLLLIVDAVRERSRNDTADDAADDAATAHTADVDESAKETEPGEAAEDYPEEPATEVSETAAEPSEEVAAEPTKRD